MKHCTHRRVDQSAKSVRLLVRVRPSSCLIINQYLLEKTVSFRMEVFQSAPSLNSPRIIYITSVHYNSIISTVGTPKKPSSCTLRSAHTHIHRGMSQTTQPRLHIVHINTISNSVWACPKPFNLDTIYSAHKHHQKPTMGVCQTIQPRPYIVHLNTFIDPLWVLPEPHILDTIQRI